LEPHFAVGSAAYVQGAMLLAALSGVVLLLMAILRLGFLANFLSYPVISGFISASGVLIALSQIKHILGVEVGGQNLPALLPALWQNLPDIHWPTAIIGGSALLFLQWMRKGAGSFLQRFKLSQASISLLTKVGPVLAIVVSVLVVWRLGLAEQGVKVVGEVPKGLPVFIVPTVDVALVQLLFPAALL